MKQMVAQSFSFSSEKFVQRILAGIKTCTSRPITNYRGRCEQGTVMHLFYGMRTPHCKKIASVTCIHRSEWCVDNLNYPGDFTPVDCDGWNEFALIEGFDSFNEMREWFTSHYDREQYLYCYQWDPGEINNSVQQHALDEYLEEKPPA
jgi:hypothetical protein